MPGLVLATILALPFIGALALLFLDVPPSGEPRRDSLPLLLVLTTFVAALSLPHIPLRWPEATQWLPFGLNAPLTLRINEVRHPFLWALGLVGIATTLSGAATPGRRWSGAVLVWGGALVMVLADNLLSLFLGWLMCDVGVLIAALQNESLSGILNRVVVNLAGGLILIGGALALRGRGVSGLAQSVNALPFRWLVLFLIAGAIRAGVYPFHRSAYPSTHAPLQPFALARVSAVLAGTYLWLQGWPALQLHDARWSLIVIAGGFIALISGLLAWGARNAASLLVDVIAFELGVILLNLGLNTHVTRLLALLELANVVLGVAVLGIAVGAATSTKRSERIVHQALIFLALAALLGLPPTVGFVARWGLYRHALETAALSTALPVAVASGLLVAPLLSLLRGQAAADAPAQGWQYAGTLLLGGALLLVSAQPLLLSPVLAPLVQMSPYSMMRSLVRGASSGMGMRITLLLLVPVLFGYSLDQVHASLTKSQTLEAISRFLDLGWLYELLVSATLRAVIALGIILAFLQASSTVEWAMLAGLILLLILLRW